MHLSLRSLTIALLIAAAFLTVGCTNTRMSPARTWTHNVAAAHGYAAWQSKPAIAADVSVTFGDKPARNNTFIFDPAVGKVRMTNATGLTVVFDGQTAWASPPDMANPRARFNVLTWPYFIAAPFKLNDPGTYLSEPTDALFQGRSVKLTTLTFAPGTGDAPDDWYKLYIDPDTHQLLAMAYIVTYSKSKAEAENAPHAIVYHDPVTLDGITLATRWTFHDWSEDQGPHGDPIGNASMSNLHFVTPNPTTFTRPENAVEVPTPNHPPHPLHLHPPFSRRAHAASPTQSPPVTPMSLLAHLSHPVTPGIAPKTALIRQIRRFSSFLSPPVSQATLFPILP